MNLEFSTEKTKMDVDFIQSVLQETYWNKGITKENVQTCIANSVNYGLFLEGKQIGYARVVTDFFRCAYLFDVIIEPSLLGRGYGRKLMDFVMNEPTLLHIKNWILKTRDAHHLYEKYGFKKVSAEESERIMTLAKV